MLHLNFVQKQQQITQEHGQIHLKKPTNLSIKNLNVRFVVGVGWRLPIDNDIDAYQLALRLYSILISMEVVRCRMEYFAVF